LILFYSVSGILFDIPLTTSQYEMLKEQSNVIISFKQSSIDWNGFTIPENPSLKAIRKGTHSSSSFFFESHTHKIYHGIIFLKNQHLIFLVLERHQEYHQNALDAIKLSKIIISTEFIFDLFMLLLENNLTKHFYNFVPKLNVSIRHLKRNHLMEDL